MGILQSICVRLFGVNDPKGEMPQTQAANASQLAERDCGGGAAPRKDDDWRAAPQNRGETAKIGGDPAREAPENPGDCLPGDETANADNFDKSKIRRVLFICSGNICRSPYAEARLRDIFRSKNIACHVASCGTLRLIGRRAADDMIAVAHARGLDLSEHRSRALSKSLIAAADIIFAMSPEHRREVLRIAPEAADRAFLLGMRLAEPKQEIADPMGRPIAAYRKAAQDIDEALGRWIDAVGF